MQSAVELRVNGYILRGMVHRPAGEGLFPAVVLFHGFTGTKLEPHGIFRKMAQVLESLGICSVRFDFGGHGESDGDFQSMTLTREVQEAHAVFKYTRDLPFVDQERIGLLGLSLGGAVASIVAGDLPAQIRALSLWAPAGMIKEVFQGILQNLEPPDSRGYLDVWGNCLGPEAGLDAAKWDVYQRASPYAGPVLLIHGSADSTVPLEASHRYQAVYKNRAKFVVIDDGDHTFNRVAWEKQVIEETAEFFKGTLT